MIQERDRYRSDLKEVSDAREKLDKEKRKFIYIMNERVDQLEKTINIKNAEIETLKGDLSKVEKQYENMRTERDRLKVKIIKMKNRRLKTDIEEKMCKKCAKEYTENENFNWSCRTHPS